MNRYFKATFTNGAVRKRASASRVYTHAYQFITKGGGGQFGFSTSEAQCLANMEAESAWVRRNQGPNQFEEVTAVEEITAKEYRQK